MQKLLLFILLMTSNSTFAISFQKAIEKLSHNELLEAKEEKVKAIGESAKLAHSWGDPKLSIAARNFPVDSLKDNETPMTGIEFGLSQKIALTTKYRNKKDSLMALKKSEEYISNDLKERLLHSFWKVLITKRKLEEQREIYLENKVFIEKILKVTKKLYANGKASQQAILEIEIRKSEIETKLINNSFELSKLEDELIYLVGAKSIEVKSIPWKLLEKNGKSFKDFKELSLKEKLSAKNYDLQAAKLNYIPDITVSIGYTKRSNIDNNGDFVGASISFPLPTSSEKSSTFQNKVFEKNNTIKEFENYKRLKEKEKSILLAEKRRLISELDILQKKSIRFASNSRKITSKSFGLGNSSYIEVLQSELILQKLLLKKSEIKSAIAINSIDFKYLLGEKLNE